MLTIHAPHIISPDTVEFRYTCATYGAFAEQVTWPVSAQSIADFTALMNLMAAVMGVSYYKAAASDAITIDVPLGPHAQAVVKAVYTEGLGEFYFRNALHYPPQIDWHFSNATPELKQSVPTKAHAIMAFGGGKDSHAAMALMDAADMTYIPASVILDERVGERLQSMLTQKLIFIRRVIAPELIALARAKKGYNGHIPITAINALILMVEALRTGSDAVIFANERGASKPTIIHDGHPINHQYSKSIAFEKLMQSALHECVGASPKWFSMLRPFSELWIARTAATRAKAAHHMFTSCNRNFIFAGQKVLRDGERWCGTCPKCVFTATLFAPYCDAPQMDEIFEKDVLGNPDNIQMARDLSGIGIMKPWECVGDVEDSAAALAMLAAHPIWQNKAVIAALAPELDTHYGLDHLRKRFATELILRGEDLVPENYRKPIL